MKKITFEVNQHIHSKSVMIRTCHAFTKSYYTDLDDNGNGKWIVTLRERTDNSMGKHDDPEAEFRNELLNESFREMLMEKSKTVKEIVVARALFGADGFPGEDPLEALDLETDFSDTDEDFDDYMDDPLGIAVPWEEKYQNGTKAKDANQEQYEKSNER
ncbi:hypothetical protein [Desulfobacter sp.]|uniref:hypothetical protein n=1 Tax=Desulfobacter sp. TaxID=2294 RepID=UPI003D118443